MKTFHTLSALVLACATAQAQTPQWADPPRLVVGIVIDQMRVDHIYRNWDNFGQGGFKRITGEGSFQRDAHYDYVPTYTAPGHASIYTGTTPARHGIVANYPWRRDIRSYYYIAKDTTVAAVGTKDERAQRSPVQLLASTLADELELRTDGRGKTISVALKDRSAIMPVGRTGDAAYWYIGGQEGKFATSSWYRSELPPWLNAFNAKGLAAKYLGQPWDLLLPKERYHAPLPDNNSYEAPIAKGIPPTLPVDLPALRKAGNDLGLIVYTPWGNTLTTDMAMAAVEGEHMGADTVPDLLAISYSSTDELAHLMGPRALEVEDMYIRLDRELERLLTFLDKSVGAGEYTVFLTGDHGGADVPAFLRDRRGSAGYTSMKELRQWMDGRGLGQWVEEVGQGQVFLRADAPQGTAEALAAALAMHPAIAAALPASRLGQMGAFTGLARAMARGYMPQRCGDVLFQLQPGFLEKEDGNDGKGTSHGSAWNYDNQVPVIFYGKHIARNEVLRRTSITDIVPTVCTLLGMALPNAADGLVVPEVLAR